MDDQGEPIAVGQANRKAVDARALSNALFAVAFFGGVWLVNGILFILLIGLLQAFGLWEASSSEGAESAITELSSRLRLRVTAG